MPLLFTDVRCRGRGGRRGVLALVALIVAVLAALVGPAGAATAAVTPKDGGPTTAAASAPAASASAAGPTAEGAPKAAPAPKAPPAKPEAKRPDPAAARAEAAREAGRTAAADTCSGAIAPDTIHTCAAPTGDGPSRFTLTLTSATDLVLVQAVRLDGQSAYAVLSAPDGSAVTCAQPQSASGEMTCPTNKAGVYTLDVNRSSGSGFSISYRALLSSTTCTTVAASSAALGAPKTFEATLAAGSTGDCYRLPAAIGTGSVLRARLTTYQVDGTVFDATGKQVCGNDSAQAFDCKLTGTAPYTLLINDDYGRSEAYGFTVARLSNASGCPVVNVQPYGTVPDATSTAPCRILRVTAAGPYSFGPTEIPSWISGQLFRVNGTAACTPTLLEPCTLAAGYYTWARDTNNTTTDAYGIWFYATNQSTGCTDARDDGFASGPAQGTFTGAGQRLCRTLPTATGKGLYLYDNPPADGGADVATTVYDAKGVRQCEATSDFSTCKLTGTAPFRAVLSGPATGAYRLTVHDTGNTAGCATWNSTPFGPSPGTRFDLTADKQVTCLALAAGKHSTAEMIDYTNTSNRVNASVQIHDGAGEAVCSTVGGSTTSCVLQAAPAYTALLIGTGYADSYRLVRRDISQTAKCPAPKSLTVGGESTGYTFNSALDSTCVQFKAAATDKFVFSVRTPGAAYRTGAVLVVADATGKAVCRQWAPCRVTGSTGYLVYVLASGYGGTPIAAHIDTWRVATAAGWAPECTTKRITPENFPVRGGTLTETAAGYCAVATMKPDQRFNVYGAGDQGRNTPFVRMLSSTGFTGSGLDPLVQCGGNNVGDFSFYCMTSSSAPAGEYLFLLDGYEAPLPLKYQMQGVCTSGCATWPKQADATSVSPATSPAETTTKVALRGTNLTLGTQVELRSNGSSPSPYRLVRATAVNTAGTVLVVELSTFGVAPGTYDLVLDSPGYTSGTRSPGYLPGAYKVTAAPPPAKTPPGGHPQAS